MTGTGDLGGWGVLIAVIGGAIRVSVPYLFVSLGETLTEKGGRVNLGLEGILVMGAMSGYGVAVITGEPWLGVFVAGLAGASLALLHGFSWARRSFIPPHLACRIWNWAPGVPIRRCARRWRSIRSSSSA